MYIYVCINLKMNILYIQYIPLLGLIGLIALINSVNRLTVNQVNLQHVQRSQKKWTVWQKLQPSHTATGWASGFHVAESSKQFQSPSLKSSGHILIHWSKSSLKSASIQKILHYPKTGNKNRIWALHRYLNHWRLHNFAMEKWLYDATQTCLTAAGGATGATWDGVGVGCGRRFRSIFFSMRKTKATLELQIQLWRNWDSLQTSLSLHLELDASCQYVLPLQKHSYICCCCCCCCETLWHAWPWTSVGCYFYSPWNTEAPTLSGFGSPHLRQVAFRANLAGFGDGRINLEVSCFSTRYPYEIIRPKKSLGSTSMWPIEKLANQFFKKNLVSLICKCFWKIFLKDPRTPPFFGHIFFPMSPRIRLMITACRALCWKSLKVGEIHRMEPWIESNSTIENVAWWTQTWIWLH